MPHTILSDEILRTVSTWAWVDAIYRWRARDILRKTRIHQHLPKSGLLLDLGSGLGHLAEAIIRDAPARSCVMLDPVSTPSRRVARRLAGFSCHATKASGAHLPFPASTFDGIWASFMLHHVPPELQEAVLDEIVRVLRPAAPFVLLEDTPATAKETETTLRADRRLNVEGEDAPHHYRSPDEWRNDLSNRGLMVEREIAFTRVFPPATLRPVQHRAFICRRR